MAEQSQKLPYDGAVPLDLDSGAEPAAGSSASLPADAEAISLVEDVSDAKPARLKAFGAAAIKTEKASEFNRPLNVNGQGATRCRVFYSKIAVAPLQYMENQINQWLDSEEAEIKHVGHVIGDLVGKTREQNLIVMAWY